MKDLLDRLDEAFQRQAAGQAANEPELAELLVGLSVLESLREVPELAPEPATARRRALLAQAKRPTQRRVVAVPSRPLRLKRFGRWAWAKLAAAVALAVLTLGAATTYAAQGSLPAEPLYPIKLAAEDLRFALATHAESELILLLQGADRRVYEMIVLVESGHIVPDDTLQRLDHHLQAALRLASQQPEPTRALGEVQAVLSVQAERIGQARQARPENTTLQQAERLLHSQLALTALGLAEPDQLRQILGSDPRDHEPLATPDHEASHTPGSQPTMTRPGHPTPHHTPAHTATPPPAATALQPTETHPPAATHVPSHTPQASATHAPTATHQPTQPAPPSATHGPAPTDHPPTATHEPVATQAPTGTPEAPATHFAPATHVPAASETPPPHPHATATVAATHGPTQTQHP